MATYKFVRHEYRGWVSRKLNKIYGASFALLRDAHSYCESNVNICDDDLKSFITVPEDARQLYVTVHTKKPRSMSNVLEVKNGKMSYELLVRGAGRFKRVNTYTATYAAVIATLAKHGVEQLYLAFEYE